MFSFFKKKNAPASITASITDFSFLGCDMHSHMVPGIDDGSQSLEDSIRFVTKLSELGFKKLITTPHIHGEMYDNDTIKVQSYFKKLQEYVQEHIPDLSIGVSAEYFLDNYFQDEVLPKGLMPFANNNVLVEVSMAGWPRNFKDLIFNVQANGYRPILAHPERYLYETDTKIYEDLKAKGILLQMNLLSITGYYGKTVQDNATKMMERNLYDLCGTDLHHERHLAKIESMPAQYPEIMCKLNEYGFKNKELY
jgi:protein-tyrosine phosphatase